MHAQESMCVVHIGRYSKETIKSVECRGLHNGKAKGKGCWLGGEATTHIFCTNKLTLSSLLLIIMQSESSSCK
jgi:hypothetical protein